VSEAWEDAAARAQDDLFESDADERRRDEEARRARRVRCSCGWRGRLAGLVEGLCPRGKNGPEDEHQVTYEVA